MVRVCKICGLEYTATGRAQKYCPTCGEIRIKQVGRDNMRKYRKEKNPEWAGVGKGNHQGKGKEHHSYKNGSGSYSYKQRVLTARPHICERCSKDLSDIILTNKFGYAIHHKDYDHSNSDDDNNLELLCKRCHQIEHNCASHLMQGIVH
jgi:predicted RNA-binding Zn-ribbon protein involved in translation (DUF1610 family)